MTNFHLMTMTLGTACQCDDYYYYSVLKQYLSRPQILIVLDDKEYVIDSYVEHTTTLDPAASSET